MSRRASLLAAAALIALYGWMAASVSRDHSVVADEIAHITAGYAYWKTGDFRLQPENGNLPQRLGALPLLAMDVHFPPLDQEAWRTADVWELGFQFFYERGNDCARILLAGRSMIAMVGMAGAALVYGWSLPLFGPAGAVVSTALFAFCPNLLAHGGLVTSDMTAAFTLLAAVLALWRLLHRVSFGRIAMTGAAIAALSLSKFSAPMILPIALLLAAARARHRVPLPVVLGFVHRRTRGAEAAAWGAGSWVASAALAGLLVWAAYGFRYAAIAPPPIAAGSLSQPWSTVLLETPPVGHFTPQERALLHPGIIQSAIRFSRDHRLLPEGWLYGFAYVCRFALWRPAFLLGEYSTTGWLSFFPIAFALKTPLSVFGMVALAAVSWTAVGRARTPAAPKNHHRRRLAYRMAPLAVLFCVYWAFALTSHLDIGLRHLLPIYPVIYIACGAVALGFHRRVAVLLAAGLAALNAASSLAARPDYLAYFNPLLGGEAAAYRHLVDSSLDWGQDLPGLKRWLDRNQRPNEPLFLSYFGSGYPPSYGIHATRLADGYFDLRSRRLLPPMTGGLYCISATMFQQVYTQVRHGWTPEHERRYRQLEAWAGAIGALGVDHSSDEAGRPLSHDEAIARLVDLEHLRFGRLCRWLQGREPDDNVGHSILIFRLSDAEVARFLRGPAPPFTG